LVESSLAKEGIDASGPVKWQYTTAQGMNSDLKGSHSGGEKPESLSIKLMWSSLPPSRSLAAFLKGYIFNLF
jgi:hypothetical protein